MAGRKWALRRRGPDGVDQAEVVGIGRTPTDVRREREVPAGDDRPLLVDLVRDGEVVGREPLSAARERHLSARAALPARALQLSKGDPALPTVYEQEHP